MSILPSKGHLQPGRFHCCFFQCIKGRQECPQGILPTVCCRSRDIMNHLLSCSADDQNSRALELDEEFIWKLSTATHVFFSPSLESKTKTKFHLSPGHQRFSWTLWGSLHGSLAIWNGQINGTEFLAAGPSFGRCESLKAGQGHVGEDVPMPVPGSRNPRITSSPSLR